MALPAFDTHAYVKRLKAAGFNEKQAEAQAELQADVLSSLITEKLATKDDIVSLENRMKQEFSDLKHEFSDLKQDFIHLRGEFNLVRWMLGFLLAGMVATLVKLFLH